MIIDNVELTRDILAKSKNNQEPTLKPVINKEMPTQVYQYLVGKTWWSTIWLQECKFFEEFSSIWKCSSVSRILEVAFFPQIWTISINIASNIIIISQYLKKKSEKLSVTIRDKFAYSQLGSNQLAIRCDQIESTTIFCWLICDQDWACLWSINLSKFASLHIFPNQHTYCHSVTFRRLFKVTVSTQMYHVHSIVLCALNQNVKK